MKHWTLQDAKARFSELVNRAQREGPQIVSRRGLEAVVVLSVEEFHALTRRGGGEDLPGFLRNSPLAELPESAFERGRDPGRGVAL